MCQIKLLYLYIICIYTIAVNHNFLISFPNVSEIMFICNTLELIGSVIHGFNCYTSED